MEQTGKTDKKAPNSTKDASFKKRLTWASVVVGIIAGLIYMVTIIVDVTKSYTINVSLKDKTIKGLKIKNKELEDKNISILKNCNDPDLTEKLADTEERERKLNKDISICKDDKFSLVKENNDLKAAVELSKTKYLNTSKELANSLTRGEILEVELEGHKRAYKELQNKLRYAQTDLSDQINKNDICLQENSALKATVQGVKNQNVTLKNEDLDERTTSSPTERQPEALTQKQKRLKFKKSPTE